MQIQAEIVGQNLAFEDIGQQFLVARPEQDGVMRHVGIFAARAEIPDEQAHRIARALDAFVGPARARLGRQQMPVGPGRIGVGDHDVGGDGLAGRQPHAAAAPSFDDDLATSAPQRTAPPCPSISFTSPSTRRPGAAQREMHAPAPLQERDQAIDRLAVNGLPPISSG
jgi:hypothetical protein